MKSIRSQLASLSTDVKNKALLEMSKVLFESRSEIETANQKDLERAETEGLAAPLLARLKFQGSKIRGVCEGLELTARLEDPVGRVMSCRELDTGLELFQVACPLGTIGMIFESRPDALVQIASLCVKSGNAVVLKGGSEASETNQVLAKLLVQAGQSSGLPDGWLFLAQSRAEVGELLSLNEYVDLLIPRGSNEFVQYIMKNTTIPVMGHADGLCHGYIDSNADVEMAVSLCVDSKTQYVAVCNAMETLLIHSDIARYVLPPLKIALESRGVELRGCSKTREIFPTMIAADEQDWESEYLDLILSIKIVTSLDKAITHINTYGSGHTDMIVTRDLKTAKIFMEQVDSANVFWNASTRFADGFRYGFGAEVGVSTGKLHARGPVGLEGLVTYKWKLYGDGHLVSDYAGTDPKSFTHRKLDKKPR